MEPAVVELESWRAAQNAPTPYAVFALIYNGRLVADHQISRTRFRNIMRGFGCKRPASRWTGLFSPQDLASFDMWK